MKIRLLSALLLGVTLSFPAFSLPSALECGELKNFGDIGPWDYADPANSVSTGADPMGRIKRVENVHFTPEMQQLNLQKWSVDRLTNEFHYTLRAFPNHPRALLAISRLEKMAGGKLPQKTTIYTPKITAECFFERAIRFRPNDKAVKMVYGIHLQQRGKLNEALVEYQAAESLGEESANFYYNFGLLYAEMKKWEKAYEYALKAQALGLMLPGLKSKLEQSGHPLPSMQ